MKESGLCVIVGKCVGLSYRSITGKSRKFGQFLSNAGKSMVKEINGMCSRLGCSKTADTEDADAYSQLVDLEMKQKEDFSKLGGEIFRLKESELDSIFPEEDVKEILSKVREDKARIQEIKDDINLKKKKKEEIDLFEHALEQLKSSEQRSRRAALQVLEKLGKKEAIPEIAELLEDEDPEVRSKARSVIQKITELDKKTDEQSDKDLDDDSDEKTDNQTDEEPNEESDKKSQEQLDEEGSGQINEGSDEESDEKKDEESDQKSYEQLEGEVGEQTDEELNKRGRKHKHKKKKKKK